MNLEEQPEMLERKYGGRPKQNRGESEWLMGCYQQLGVPTTTTTAATEMVQTMI